MSDFYRGPIPLLRQLAGLLLMILPRKSQGMDTDRNRIEAAGGPRSARQEP